MSTNSFVESASKTSNKTATENGQVAYKSTKNINLDFFAKSGNINYKSVVNDFLNAFAEDQDLAIRNLLHMRDVRGGKGIRDNSREILLALSEKDASLITDTNLVKAFVEVGRWDDIFEILKGTQKRSSNFILNLITEELQKQEPNKLLAKWLPRQMRKKEERKSNYDLLPQLLQKRLKLTPKQYRQLLVANTSVVETPMCAKNWKDIKFQHVPSKAHNIYRKAFKLHAPDEYTAYLAKVDKGQAKINASTLWPHEVIPVGSAVDPTQEALWKSLPNYMPEGVSILPVVDVSGSMSSISYGKYSAMHIALSMGIYCASNNKSAFKDLFMTFTDTPEFVSLSGSKTLQSKITTTRRSRVGYSTNFFKMIEAVVNQGTKNKVPQQDMPSAILVLTDMQINDSCVRNKPTQKVINELFKAAGYKTPHIIWWNICGGEQRVDGLPLPVKKSTEGAALVSGYSPSIIKSIFNTDFDNFTPLNVMKETLSSSRYDWQ
jgi:hypothetical protein